MSSESRFSKNKLLPRLLAVAFWLLVWQLCAVLFNSPLLLSSPLRVGERLFALIFEKGFWDSVLFSFSRVAAGFGLGTVLGFVLSYLASKFSLLETLLRPLMLTVRSVPVASFIILALVWLSGKRLSVFISFLMVLPVIYHNLLQGFASLPGEMREAAKMYRVSPLRRLYYMELPHLKPHLMGALSVALGMSWKSGIAAEVIGIPAGSIGEQLYQSKIYLDMTSLYAWTAVILLISVVFEKFVLTLVRLFYRNLEAK